MRMKALRITNWLREQVGLPPVIPHPHRGPHFHGHQPGFEGPHHMGMHDGHHQLSPPPAFEIRPLKVEGHLHHRPTAVALPSQFYDFRTSSFMDRLANAIMSLGPWEGRAVAFVIGRSKISLLRAVQFLCHLRLWHWIAHQNVLGVNHPCVPLPFF